MRLRIPSLTRQAGQNRQFDRGHHSWEYLVTVPSFTDILNILNIDAGVYILQKYDYYSPAIIKGQIILPYIQFFFSHVLGTQFPAFNAFFFRVDPPYYCVFVRLGPSPKLKLEPKGLDQSRTLNSHNTTTKLFHRFKDTYKVENQHIVLLLAKNSIAMKKSPTLKKQQTYYFWF